MKILLLSDIPPCKNFTAGIVLNHLCSFLPKGSLACYAVVHPILDPQIPPSLNWMPIQHHKKPRENWAVLPGWPGSIVSFVMESYISCFDIARIASKAIKFGREFGAEAVWCILEGQTMIRLAVPVSRGLGVPLYTQVWDPPSWWMRENKVNRFSAQRVQRDFERSLRKSVKLAAASWAMAEQYKKNYGAQAIPVVPGLDSGLALPPASEPNPGSEFIIGLAGQIYASAEWNALIAALDSVDWQIGARDVKILILGRYAHLTATRGCRVEFLGWHSQEETIRILSKTDVLYCPYWFDPDFEVVSRLSFPSKLTTYLAVGRPVLFHGPSYASPARFLEKYQGGICCYTLEASAIVKQLELLASDEDLYSKVTVNGRAAFDKNLTMLTMRKSFLQFLQLEEKDLQSDAAN